MEPDFDNPDKWSKFLVWNAVEYGHKCPVHYVTLEVYQELLAAYKELKFRMEGLEK